MQRRTFLKLAGVTTLATATKQGQSAASPPISSTNSTNGTTPRWPVAALYECDKGYDDKEPFILRPGPHLFTDWRYVSPGGIGWLGPDGKPIHYFADKDP